MQMADVRKRVTEQKHTDFQRITEKQDNDAKPRLFRVTGGEPFVRTAVTGGLLYTLQYIGLLAIIASELLAAVKYGINGIALPFLASTDYGYGILGDDVLQQRLFGNSLCHLLLCHLQAEFHHEVSLRLRFDGRSKTCLRVAYEFQTDGSIYAGLLLSLVHNVLAEIDMPREALSNCAVHHAHRKEKCCYQCFYCHSHSVDFVKNETECFILIFNTLTRFSINLILLVVSKSGVKLY